MCAPRYVRLVVGLIALLICRWGMGDEEAVRKLRLQMMEQVIADVEIESAPGSSQQAPAFSPKPLLRYSDPTRGLGETDANVLLDASVWRLGVAGRPTALVTLEIYRSTTETGVLSYEFL